MSVVTNLSAEAQSASLKIFGPATHAKFSTLLDSSKVLLTSSGLHRDWRGLAECARLDVPSLAVMSRISFTTHCLHLWARAGGIVKDVMSALARMDRFDVIEDTCLLIEGDYFRIKREGHPAIPPSLQAASYESCIEDENILTIHDRASIERGEGLVYYDALVLHSDKDIKFVRELENKLEKQYGLQLCIKDRDLVAGLQFESASLVSLITNRCRRVIVLLSTEFITSPFNNFFINFATALSIEQRRRVLIPCMLEPCLKPDVISFCHSLDFFRAQGYWDFWSKLRDSIVAVSSRPQPTATITEITNTNSLLAINNQSGYRDGDSESKSSLATFSTTEEVKVKAKKWNPTVRSVSNNFMSKFRRKSEGKNERDQGKNKPERTSISDNKCEKFDSSTTLWSGNKEAVKGISSNFESETATASINSQCSVTSKVTQSTDVSGTQDLDLDWGSACRTAKIDNNTVLEMNHYCSPSDSSPLNAAETSGMQLLLLPDVPDVVKAASGTETKDKRSKPLGKVSKLLKKPGHRVKITS